MVARFVNWSLWKRLLPLIAVFMMITLSQLARGESPPPQNSQIITIGFLEGRGKPGDQGVRLAIDQINRTGGITGPDGTLYRLQIAYPQNPPVSAEDIPAALQSLTAQGVVAIVGPTNNDFALPNLEPLARIGVPVLTLATSDTLTDVDVTNNIMRMRAAERYYSTALADYLLNDLGLTDIALMQTDVPSTEALLIFEQVLINNSRSPVMKIQQLDSDQIAQNAADILQVSPDAIVMWGRPDDAATLIQTLRAGNFPGVIVYRDIIEAVRDNIISPRLAQGVVGVTSWSYGNPDDISQTFLLDFVTAFNTIPDSNEAAAYDSIWILRREIEESGSQMPALYEGLLQTPTIVTVQGRLDPPSYGNGDFARHVTIYSVSELGGPVLQTLYANNERLPDSSIVRRDPDRIVGMIGTITFTPSPTPIPSETPIPSPTPNRVEVVVNRPIINVRSGPGTDFEQVGQLEEGTRSPVIGTNLDFTWYLIRFRGSSAWVSADVVDIFDPGGLVALLPIVTPAVVTTPIDVIQSGGTQGAPTTGIDLIIESVLLVPTTLTPNQPFTAQVTIRNLGNTPAGSFTVATTFEPGGVQASNIVPSVPAGGTSVSTLNATVAGPGAFQVAVIVDAANTVAESNEGNNTFNLSYRVDSALIAQVQSFSMPLNTAIDMAGGTADILWNGSFLQAENGTRLAVLQGAAYDAVFYGSIDPNIINQTVINDAQVQSGIVIGVITAEGRRAVIGIDGRNVTAVTLSFRVYSD
jgi:ABC-type branched-subunit amino acid transport system substrate-binding protein